MTTATSSIALYWDFENIERAVRDSGGARVDIDAVVQHVHSLGPIAVHRAYANWSRFGRYAEALQRHAVELVQLFPLTAYREGERAKNGADVRLAVDAIDDLNRFPYLTDVVVATGDCDFVGLAQKTRSMGRSIHGTGVGRSVNPRWKAACDSFTYYEDVLPTPETVPTPVVAGVATIDLIGSATVRPLRPVADDAATWERRLRECGWKPVTPAALVATVDALPALFAAANAVDPQLPVHKALLAPIIELLDGRGFDPVEARRIITVLYKAGLAVPAENTPTPDRSTALELIARAAFDRLHTECTVEPDALACLLFGDESDGLAACRKARAADHLPATAC